MPAHDPETIRQAAAKQTTVGHSVVAMLDGIAAATAHDGGQAWAKAYTTDPRAWADAVLANTPHAVETTERDAPAPPAPEKHETTGERNAKAATQANPHPHR